MSSYVNNARDDVAPLDQKAIFTTYALVVVSEDEIDAFDRPATALNNRRDGRTETKADGFYLGWLSYTARGANLHDITRRFESLAQVFPLTRVLVMEDEAE